MIKRILKGLLKGVVKSVPIVNVIAGASKDLNKKAVADQYRQIAKHQNDSCELKLHLYNVADLLDDGKANESFNMKLIDKGVELIGSILALAAGALAVANEFGWV